MRIAEINMVDYGSTGKIMLQIADVARKKGHEVRTFSKKWKRQVAPNQHHSYFGTTLENGIHVLLYRLIGFQGLFSYFGTKQLVRELEKFHPDIVHLHNLHDSCLCLPVLFRYIKKNDLSVIWTMHDCWPLTGQCPYFTASNCNKWKAGCNRCEQLTARIPVDCSAFMWKHKRKWFNGIEKMRVVTPSNWLADIVRESYMGGYPISVIYNGVDLSMFQPRQSDFRRKFGIADDKFVLLGVALGWGKRKGLDVFIELANRLDSQRYSIVLVGTDEEADRQLPPRILSIHRTQNQIELAEIYSAADLFVNPTREDNFPTTNIEALACGTPVLTFRTGGSPEALSENCGSVVACDDVDGLVREIDRVFRDKPYTREDCRRRANSFDKNDRFREYVEFFDSKVSISEEIKNENCSYCP